MVKTKIAVISLPASKVRREQFSELAAGVNTPWQFFDAYDRAVPPLFYDEALARARFGRPLAPGEVGVYTSHYSLWLDLTTSAYDQLIVLEDDVIPDWAVIERLCNFDFSSKGIDILRLFSTHTFPSKLVMHRLLSSHYHLLRCEGFAMGVQGYLLTKRGARALLTTGNVVYEPIDWTISRYWIYGLPAYFLFPFPIIERHAPSVIGSARETAHESSIHKRLEWMRWKIVNRLKREYANRILLAKHPFGRPTDQGQAFIDRVDPRD